MTSSNSFHLYNNSFEVNVNVFCFRSSRARLFHYILIMIIVILYASD